MKRILAAMALAAAIASPAMAQQPPATPPPAPTPLAVGTKAPEIVATGMLDGKEFQFKLSEAEKKGPVVIYFFPAAYTAGCTIETKAFAEAADDFKAAGATLIGLTGGAVDPKSADPKKRLSAKDNLAVLQRFSEEECRNKFSIAAVTPETIKAYQVELPSVADWSYRTSYVIGKDGKVVLAHADMKPDGHITKTLEAVKALKH